MSAEVETNFKDNQGACGCGCEVFGTFRARPWRDGVLCVRRGCSCKRCLGKRSRAKGDSRARQARKALNIAGANSRHEEHWAGAVRTEMKAGGQVKPAVTAFLRMEAQSEQERPVGDTRPFVGVALPDGSKDGVVMFRLSKLEQTVAALYEQLYEGGRVKW